MTMIYQEDSYVNIDCLKCSLSLFMVHKHNSDQESHKGTSSDVLDKD